MAIPLLQMEPTDASVRWPAVRLYVVEGGRPAASTYRRRRVAAVFVVVAMVVALALSLRVGAAVLGGGPASAPEPRPLVVSEGAAARFGGQLLAPGATYVAQPGDTMWAIARALQPEGDLAGLVGRLVRLNGGPELAVGDRVTLPG